MFVLLGGGGGEQKTKTRHHCIHRPPIPMKNYDFVCCFDQSVLVCYLTVLRLVVDAMQPATLTPATAAELTY